MSFFAEEKAALRQVVHETLAMNAARIPAASGTSAQLATWAKLLSNSAGSASIPVSFDRLTVRAHNKMALYGDLSGEGYPEYLDSEPRLIFYLPELEIGGGAVGWGLEYGDSYGVGGLTPIELSQGDVIALVDPGMSGQTFFLSALEPKNGPYEQIWKAAQL